MVGTSNLGSWNEIPWSGMGTIHVLYRTEIWGQGAGTRAKSWESKFQAAMQPHVSPISASKHIVKYLQQLWGAWFWLRPLPVYGFGGVHVLLPIVQDHPYLKWLDHGTCFRIQDPKNPAYLQLIEIAINRSYWSVCLQRQRRSERGGRLTQMPSLNFIEWDGLVIWSPCSNGPAHLRVHDEVNWYPMLKHA